MTLFRRGFEYVELEPRMVADIGVDKLAALGLVKVKPAPRRYDQLPRPLDPGPPVNRADRRARDRR